MGHVMTEIHDFVVYLTERGDVYNFSGTRSILTCK